MTPKTLAMHDGAASTAPKKWAKSGVAIAYLALASFGLYGSATHWRILDAVPIHVGRWKAVSVFHAKKADMRWVRHDAAGKPAEMPKLTADVASDRQ